MRQAGEYAELAAITVVVPCIPQGQREKQPIRPHALYASSFWCWIAGLPLPILVQGNQNIICTVVAITGSCWETAVGDRINHSAVATRNLTMSIMGLLQLAMAM